MVEGRAELVKKRRLQQGDSEEKLALIIITIGASFFYLHILLKLSIMLSIAFSPLE